MSLPRFQPARDFLASGAYRELADKRLELMVNVRRLSFRVAVLLYVATVVVRFVVRHV
jgi:hypothetical protein